MNKLDSKYELLTPFKLCVIENFPFIEADFDAITNYQLMCKIVEYLNKIMKNQNLLQENVLQLNKSFIQLQEYVDKYFDNLDIQSEINNKLDEMALNGELAEIVTAYIQISGLLAYDNIETMKASTNLINGSFAQTFGFYNINDGGGALYKVREVTNQDTIDDITLIALNNPDLVAELLYNDINVKQFGAKGDGVTDDTASINLALSKGKNVIFPKGEYVTSSEITITSENIIIRGNGATIKPIHYFDCFNVNGNNIVIDSLNIDGGCNYGYDLNGSYCTIKNCNISNTLHNAIMITGSHNTIDNVVANLCGWDCVGNYGNASYNIINNCKAIKTKRHGFSSDPTTHHISFINCYCEDVGSPELVEGHSCYHFEYSDYGVVNNCKAKYTSNHPNNTTRSNSPFIGIRCYQSQNVLIDNVNIIYESDYNPLDVTRPFLVENSQNFQIINSKLVNNTEIELVGTGYVSGGPIEILNSYLKNIFLSTQDSYSGYTRKMIDNIVELTYGNMFANFTYLCDNAQFVRNKFIGHAGLEYFIRGRFVNTIFDSNNFNTGKYSIVLASSVVNYNDKSTQVVIKNNTFANFSSAMIALFEMVNGSCYVDNNLFTGTCKTVIEGNYNSCVITRNRKYDLTYTNLKLNLYVTIFDDLSSQYDYQSKAMNPSGVRYNISVDANGNVVASAI